MAYLPTPWSPSGGNDQTIPENTAPPGSYPLDTWAYGSPSDFRRAKYGSYGSGVQYNIPGANATNQDGSSKTVSKVTFSGDRPDKPNVPEYVAPEYDKRRVRSLTQKEAAPGVRRLRETVQTVVGQPEENPNVKRMTLRSALQGYGTGLESVMAGAARSAQAQYQQELNLEREEAYNNWRAQVEAEMAAYNSAMQEYIASATRTTTTTTGDEALSGDKLGGNTFDFNAWAKGTFMNRYFS